MKLASTPGISKLGKPLLSFVILGSIAAAACKLIDSYNIGSALCTMTFFFATLVAGAYRIMNPFGWTLVLAGLGYQTNTRASVGIWLLAESRRWLPGGIWGYTSRAVQAGSLGVPVSVASASMLVELMVTSAAAVIVSLLGLFFHYEQLAGTLAELLVERGRSGTMVVITAVVSVSVVLGVTGYATRRQLCRKLQTLAQRFKLLRCASLKWSRLSAALGYMLLMAGVNGCVNLCLLPILDAAGSVPVLVMIAATATAWMVGFLTFFSPGGILVREAALAALLLPWLPYEAGITLAVLSRIAQLLAEGAWLLPILFSDRRGSQVQRAA